MHLLSLKQFEMNASNTYAHVNRRTVPNHIKQGKSKVLILKVMFLNKSKCEGCEDNWEFLFPQNDELLCIFWNTSR